MPSPKPAKPYPEFPLFPHATGRWAKKIRGKTVYFGPWADAAGALQRYLDQKDDLFAGRVPRARSGDVTVKLIANTFLSSKRFMVAAGEMTARTWGEYEATCQRLAVAFGSGRLVADLQSGDFENFRAELAKVRGPHTLGNEIQRVRTIFRYAFEAGLLPSPVRYGPSFRKPSKKLVRMARAEKGLRMFEAADLRKLIDSIRPPFQAMVLLGINVAFGNSDCGRLPLSALDLEGGWVRFPRPKTGIDRRAKLWPETIASLKAAIEKRKAPASPDLDGLVFLTQFGTCYAKDTKENPISKRMTAAVQALGIHREGLNFYALRHTFRTIADESRDRPAVDLIMGHADDSMADAYRERIGDDRLIAVSNHVRTWLFGAAATSPQSSQVV